MTQNTTTTDNRQSPPTYTPSWEVNRAELPGWLRQRADQLDKRAIRANGVKDVLHCLRLAQAARNAAEWYAKNGGAQ